MTLFEFNNRQFYIDEGLRKQLIKKIFPDLSKRDKDVVFLVDGRERSGKSKFADILGAFASVSLGVPYDLSCVCMTPEEFRTKIQTANKKEVVIYDEAHRGMGSRRALSEINNILIDLMMEMGQKNLFVIIVMPTIFMLDRYPALFRARGLFHIYEKKQQRGFWVYFNEKNKQKLFILGKKLLNYNCMSWPRFRGRFLNQYAVDEEEYRRKKLKAFNEKPRITKAEHYIDQRNVLLYLIYKEFESNQSRLTRLIKQYGLILNKSVVNMVINDIQKDIERKEKETSKIIEEKLERQRKKDEINAEEENEEKIEDFDEETLENDDLSEKTDG